MKLTLVYTAPVFTPIDQAKFFKTHRDRAHADPRALRPIAEIVPLPTSGVPAVSGMAERLIYSNNDKDGPSEVWLSD